MELIRTAASGVRLVVLNACYTAAMANQGSRRMIWSCFGWTESPSPPDETGARERAGGRAWRACLDLTLFAGVAQGATIASSAALASGGPAW